MTAETEYDFKVRAVNAEGSGTASSTVTETTTAAAVTPALGWEAPSDPVGNTFSATLTSNVALDAAPTVGDLRLRDDDNSDPIVSLTSSNTTITAIAGTNNYLIELELTGTYDDDYTIRINGNTVEYNGAYVNSAQLASAVFSIDSSIGATNNAPSFSESSYSFTDIEITAGTVVGTVAATDADNDTLSYSLTGSDASDFAIDSDGEITVATALTLGDTYNFNVVADDATDTTSVTVTVTAEAAEATTLVEISGDNQTGDVDTALANPFVVEVRDQNGDPLSGVTVTWSVTAGGGALSATSVTTNASGRAQSTLTLGSVAGTNTARASASGITQTRTFTAIAGDVLSISVSVPATADTGETVNIEATVAGEDTIEWETTGGSIDDTSAADTELTVPSEAGVIAVTCVATDADGATASDTAYVTVGDLTANIYTPAYQIEIQGVDVTDRWIKRDGMTVGKSLDYPELLNFKSSGVQFNLDNADGAFDYSNPDNLFLDNSLPAHGRGAQVLVSLGRSQSELAPVFAGEISAVVTSLRNTKARIKVRDLSVVLRQKTIENFGSEITRRITDYAGANTDYDDLNPVFYFPVWALPISRGSVSLTVEEDGSDVAINVVDVVGTTGVLSNRNAEVDYSRGLIRFEAAPTDGEDTVIDATWKQDYVYKRPDFLIRSLLENAGINTLIGITDTDDARFAIEQALVRHDSDRLFSSHGRPYFNRPGIVRYLIYSSTQNKVYFIQDARLIEYDKDADVYSEISIMPSDDTIEGNPDPDFGEHLPDLSFRFNTARNTANRLDVFAYYNGFFYFITGESVIRIYNGEAELIQTYDIGLDSVGRNPDDTSTGNLHSEDFESMDIFGNKLYILRTYRVSGVNGSRFEVLVYNLPLINSSSPNRRIYLSDSTNFQRLYSSIYIAVTQTRFIFSTFFFNPNSYDVFFTDHSGGEITTEAFELERSPSGIAANENYIFIGITTPEISSNRYVEVYSRAGVEIADLSFARAQNPSRLSLEGSTLYSWNTLVSGAYNHRIEAYAISQDFNFHNFVPYIFDTSDEDTFYFLSVNTIAGDALSSSAYNRVILNKYVKSTDTWSTVLNSDKGHPQIAHALMTL